MGNTLSHVEFRDDTPRSGIVRKARASAVLIGLTFWNNFFISCQIACFALGWLTSLSIRSSLGDDPRVSISRDREIFIHGLMRNKWLWKKLTPICTTVKGRRTGKKVWLFFSLVLGIYSVAVVQTVDGVVHVRTGQCPSQEFEGLCLVGKPREAEEALDFMGKVAICQCCVD